jgi:hypothetical protein
MAAMSILDNLGAVSQLGIAGMNNQTRQIAPFLDAGLQNARNVGAGNVPYGAADPANTVSPTVDGTGPSPAGATPSVQTGSPRASSGVQTLTRDEWDAMNEDLRRRGRPDRGPYPGQNP